MRVSIWRACERTHSKGKKKTGCSAAKIKLQCAAALCAANANRILCALRTEPSAKRGYRLQRKEKTASARDAVFSLEATPGFGPGVEVLQTFALPLGYVAVFPLCSHIIADEFCFVKPFSAFVNFFVFLARGALCALLINSLCTCRDVDTMAVLCYIEHRKAVVR